MGSNEKTSRKFKKLAGCSLGEHILTNHQLARMGRHDAFTVSVLVTQSPHSTGYPAWTQAAKPPKIGLTFSNPLSSKSCATRALESSAGQVQ
jgi:hypothetical protein